MKFTESPSSEKVDYDIIDNNNGDTVEYGKSTRRGYAKYMNLYEGT